MNRHLLCETIFMYLKLYIYVGLYTYLPTKGVRFKLSQQSSKVIRRHLVYKTCGEAKE